MKALSSILLLLLPLVSTVLQAGGQAQSATNRQEPGYATVGAAPCKPVGEIQFICTLVSPEDLALVPGTEWLIASGNREGGRLHLVSVRQKTATVLFPTPKANVRFDRKAYPICPGPLDIEKPDAFRAHGLYLKPGERAVHTLYVVHHGTRESIEVFELNAGTAPPILTWVGCAPAPPKQVFNGVVALPGRGVRRDEQRHRRKAVSAGDRMEPGPGERGHGTERIGDLKGWAVAVHRRMGRREAHAPVAWPDSDSEGRHQTRIPAG